jgi:hypothetical protein
MKSRIFQPYFAAMRRRTAEASHGAGTRAETGD